MVSPASQDLRYPPGLPAPCIFSIRRAALSHHLLRVQDQPHPEAARFFQMPFAGACFWFLPPDEAALLFQPLHPSPTPYHPISGIHRLVKLM